MGSSAQASRGGGQRIETTQCSTRAVPRLRRESLCLSTRLTRQSTLTKVDNRRKTSVWFTMLRLPSQLSRSVCYACDTAVSRRIEKYIQDQGLSAQCGRGTSLIDWLQCVSNVIAR